MANTVYKVRAQLLDKDNNVIGEADVQTTADLVFFDDGETFQQKLDAGKLKGADGAKGATGATGTRGSTWTAGTACTGTSATGTVFATGIASALVNDMYLNTSTGYVYKCVTAGNASTAKWAYVGSIKGAAGAKGDTGATGAAGAKGDKGDTGATGPAGAKGDTGAKGVSMRLKGAWASGVAYVNDGSYIDIVTANGNTYGCIKSHTSSSSIGVTNTTYWQVLAQKGDTGATGPAGKDGDSIKVGTSYASATERKLFLKIIE